MDGETATLLTDWRRRVFAMYQDARADAEHDPATAWIRWRRTRDGLFSAHPQSPLPAGRRGSPTELAYFVYDPSCRVTGEVLPAEPQPLQIAASTGEPIAFSRVATCAFALYGARHTLDLYWLEGYGGGLFLPFRDETSGGGTYGAGRYLLDTVKGADLGSDDRGRLILDFNFAYNPSCAYDADWSCPLAPPANHLAVAVRAGERTPPL
jgi:uncharacterized protein (DUF1684 family)